MANYEKDLDECRKYADQVSGPGTSAAVGAGIGAALSLAVSAIFGNTGRALGEAAAAGAVVGGVTGAAAGGESEIDIVRRCMIGRGYNVLR